MIAKSLERARQAAAWVYRFALHTFRMFYSQRGLQIASALAYATLLSIVPLLTVMFAFPGGLPGFEGAGDTIQSFVFRNFVPTVGETVQGYLGGFSQNASKLTATGIVTLVVIALMLMETIDNAINAIWRVRKRRSPVGRFLVYWAMITLGPLLVGFGLFSTSYVLSLPVVSDVDVSLGLQRRLLSVLPFLTTSVAFTLLYVLVPNCYVRRAHAVAGGVIAAILFEYAKVGFGVYVRSVSTEQVYGALAVIPLFLVWIYLSWVIVLLGAYISYCLAGFSMKRDRARADAQSWDFEDVWQVLRALWQAQGEGGALSVQALSRGVRMAPHLIDDILACLEQANWVGSTSDGDWMLSRDLDTVTLWDLHRIVPRRLPEDQMQKSSDRWQRALGEALEPHRADAVRSLNIPVADILKKGSE